MESGVVVCDIDAYEYAVFNSKLHCSTKLLKNDFEYFWKPTGVIFPLFSSLIWKLLIALTLFLNPVNPVLYVSLKNYHSPNKFLIV